MEPGRALLEKVTPRNPLYTGGETAAPSLPSSRRFGGKATNEEFSYVVKSFHHRFKEKTTLEMKHKNILEKDPGAFRWRKGESQNFIEQATKIDRALAWRGGDQRQSVSRKKTSRYLVDSVAMEPYDIEDSMTITTNYSNASHLRSRHIQSRQDRLDKMDEAMQNTRTMNRDTIALAKSLTWKPPVASTEDVVKGINNELHLFEARLSDAELMRSYTKAEIMAFTEEPKRPTISQPPTDPAAAGRSRQQSISQKKSRQPSLNSNSGFLSMSAGNAIALPKYMVIDKYIAKVNDAKAQKLTAKIKNISLTTQISESYVDPMSENQETFPITPWDEEDEDGNMSPGSCVGDDFSVLSNLTNDITLGNSRSNTANGRKSPPWNNQRYIREKDNFNSTYNSRSSTANSTSMSFAELTSGERAMGFGRPSPPRPNRTSNNSRSMSRASTANDGNRTTRSINTKWERDEIEGSNSICKQLYDINIYGTSRGTATLVIMQKDMSAVTTIEEDPDNMFGGLELDIPEKEIGRIVLTKLKLRELDITNPPEGGNDDSKGSRKKRRKPDISQLMASTIDPSATAKSANDAVKSGSITSMLKRSISPGRPPGSPTNITLDPAINKSESMESLTNPATKPEVAQNFVNWVKSFQHRIVVSAVHVLSPPKTANFSGSEPITPEEIVRTHVYIGKPKVLTSIKGLRWNLLSVEAPPEPVPAKSPRVHPVLSPLKPHASHGHGPSGGRHADFLPQVRESTDSHDQIRSFQSQDHDSDKRQLRFPASPAQSTAPKGLQHMHNGQLLPHGEEAETQPTDLTPVSFAGPCKLSQRQVALYFDASIPTTKSVKCMAVPIPTSHRLIHK